MKKQAKKHCNTVVCPHPRVNWLTQARAKKSTLRITSELLNKIKQFMLALISKCLQWYTLGPFLQVNALKCSPVLHC